MSVLERGLGGVLGVDGSPCPPVRTDIVTPRHLFYESSSLFGALSLKVAIEGVEKMARMVWNAITPEYLKKLYKLLPQRVAAVI